MTRNFEEEYKKYADSNVPDLWSRIEAAIDERKEEVKPESFSYQTKNSNKVRIFTAKYAWVLAACACLLLTFGALRLINGSKNQAAAEYAAEAAAPAYEASEDMAADEYEPIANAAPATNDMAMAEEAADSEDAILGEADRKKDDNNYSAGAAAEDAKSLTFAAEAEDNMSDAAMEMPAAAEAEEEASETAMAEEAMPEEAANAQAAVMTDIMLCCRIEDMSAIKSDHTIEIAVTDPLDSGIKKGEIISVNVDEADTASVLQTLSDSKTKEFTMILKSEDGGKYTLCEVKPN